MVDWAKNTNLLTYLLTYLRLLVIYRILFRPDMQSTLYNRNGLLGEKHLLTYLLTYLLVI